MQLTGLHLLLTYQCTFECDHCFVWGSPWQSGTMRLEEIRHILDQALQTDSVNWIFFEGGEPMLYYPLLLQGVRMAHQAGYQVGIVSNAYWATSIEDAMEWLRPLEGMVADLTVSSDLYHYSEKLSRQAQVASQAAAHFNIPTDVISITQPEEQNAAHVVGMLPTGESAIMYRGRAAARLAGRARQASWETFDACPYEDLRDPGRVHIDPAGYLHICQGIAIGNIFQESLVSLTASYQAESHPIIGALLAGGPAELARRYDTQHADTFADACHLCYETRASLRGRFPDILAPDQMYGMVQAED